MNSADDTGKRDSGTAGRNARKANPIDVHVGTRVRMRRMLLSMSQEKLGELLGLTFQQVQKYEKGVNRIGASRLYELSKVLNVNVEYFFDEMDASLEGGVTGSGLSNGAESNYVSDVLSSRDGLELNKAFARIMDPRQRRAIVELAKTMAGEE
ncbi:MAG: helix-turn-helix domain-containing protein [Hyphomicrobiaceae bacterium]